MEYFVGLGVSLETVNVCIVNAAGDILLEKKIAAEPAAIVHLLKGFGSPFKRIGLEAGQPRPGFMASCVLRGTARSALNAVTSRPG